MTSEHAIRLHDQQPSDSDVESEVLEGLTSDPKRLSPKFFYDQRGSELFEQITELPEYYPTRTEIAIMEQRVDEIAERVGPKASLIEFGSGSSTKTRILLRHLTDLAAYVPVDISGDHLLDTARSLAEDYPDLEILPVAADFTQPFDLPSPRTMPERNVVFFPGSTIGNFAPDKAVELLNVMAAEAKPGGAAIVGVDLKKDPAILEAAYNDSQGVTAEFNLNVLRRINEELDADFDLSAFAHRAIYNEGAGRIEMNLVSRRHQTVNISGEIIDFRKGESILTECSYKFTCKEFAAMVAQAGFEVETVWTDKDRLFSVQFLTR
ncbi:MAG: L-histidine N(alpha)-methyltransferase [Gammaproteobacteria bacterium]